MDTSEQFRTINSSAEHAQLIEVCDITCNLSAIETQNILKDELSMKFAAF
jgi:hypothetical protein